LSLRSPGNHPASDAIITALPAIGGETRRKKAFKHYPIGYFHIDIADVRTEEGKFHLFVAIDRTSKFAFAQLHAKANRNTATAFLKDLIAIVPYKIHTVLDSRHDRTRRLNQSSTTARPKEMMRTNHGVHVSCSACHAADDVCIRRCTRWRQHTAVMSARIVLSARFTKVLSSALQR
jgi:hypothetical protein